LKKPLTGCGTALQIAPEGMNADTYVSPGVEGAVCRNLQASAVESVNLPSILRNNVRIPLYVYDYSKDTLLWGVYVFNTINFALALKGK
jgi:hypothetical protein